MAVESHPLLVQTVEKTKRQAVFTSPKFWLNAGSAVVAMATWLLAHPGMGFVDPATERQVFYWLGLVVAAGNAIHQYVYSPDRTVVLKTVTQETHKG